jgi:hypothetical protein
MPSLLSRILAPHLKLAARLTSGKIRFARGGMTSGPITAGYGRSQYLALDPAGVAPRLEYTDRDFLIVAAELLLGGGVIQPQDGDRITVIDGGPDDGCVFEVMPLPGLQSVVPCDPEGILIRVRTKRVS